MRIGVFALQGAFAEHCRALQRLGAEVKEIRQQQDMLDSPFDGYVLPGGESTVMGKLLRDLQLQQLLEAEIDRGVPVFGTCAGLLLLAKNIVGTTAAPEPVYLAKMDITAKRNAYGRQLGSFSAKAAFAPLEAPFPMVFIRAPYICSVSGTARALATVQGKIVAAQQENLLVTAFHPELTDDLRIHAYFLQLIRQSEQRA